MIYFRDQNQQNYRWRQTLSLGLQPTGCPINYYLPQKGIFCWCLLCNSKVGFVWHDKPELKEQVIQFWERSRSGFESRKFLRIFQYFCVRRVLFECKIVILKTNFETFKYTRDTLRSWRAIKKKWKNTKNPSVSILNLPLVCNVFQFTNCKFMPLFHYCGSVCWLIFHSSIC